MHKMKLFLFPILMCLFLPLMASRLTLTVNPKSPKELLTPLQLICTFEGQKSPEGKEDYLPYYMVILNDKQTLLASISKHRPAEAKYEKGMLQVEGHLPASSSDSRTSYLKLSWKRSRLDLQGTYTCTAHARNENNSATMFTTTAHVIVHRPSSEEVMTFLNNEAAIVDNIYDKNEMYYREQVKMSENIQNLAALTGNRFSETESKLNSLAVSTARHVESGEVGCGQYAGGFNLMNGQDRYIIAPISFQTPFATPPIVVYSIRHADISNGQNTRYFAYTMDNSNRGFKLVCGTFGDTHIYLFKVIWHAFN